MDDDSKNLFCSESMQISKENQAFFKRKWNLIFCFCKYLATLDTNFLIFLILHAILHK